jgi:predicted acylesterase/phospholipase RssA
VTHPVHLRFVRCRSEAWNTNDCEVNVVAGRTVMVLGGGGAMGAFQAGAIRSLLRAGIVPDVLVGCSAGALNATFLAVDPSPARAAALADLWLHRDLYGVLSPGTVARVRGLAAGRGRSLLDDRPLRRLVESHVPAHDLAELAVPVRVATACLDCAAPVLHSTGPVATLLAASCALPGLLPAVRLSDDHLHVDGGILDGVPLTGALALAGPEDRVLVLDCSLSPHTGKAGSCAAVPGWDESVTSLCGLPLRGREPRSYKAPAEDGAGVLDVVLRAFAVARTVANRHALGESRDDPRVEVLPHVADAWAAGILERLPRDPRDFSATPSLIAAGSQVTSLWLQAKGFDGSGRDDARSVV